MGLRNTIQGRDFKVDGVSVLVRYAALSLGVRLLPLVGAVLRRLDPQMRPSAGTPVATPAVFRAPANINGDSDYGDSAAA